MASNQIFGFPTKNSNLDFLAPKFALILHSRFSKVRALGSNWDDIKILGKAMGHLISVLENDWDYEFLPEAKRQGQVEPFSVARCADIPWDRGDDIIHDQMDLGCVRQYVGLSVGLGVCLSVCRYVHQYVGVSVGM